HYLSGGPFSRALATVLHVHYIVIDERADVYRADVGNPAEERLRRLVSKHLLALFLEHPADYAHVVEVHLFSRLAVRDGEKDVVALVVYEAERNVLGHLYVLALL